MGSEVSLPDTGTIVENWTKLREDVPIDVRVVAVSKYKPVEAIRTAYAAGVRDFGESRIQEAIDKRSTLSEFSDLTWHFIGHLQTNKVNAALQNMDWIHSVDSLKLARRIDAAIARGLPRPKLCLQVKFAPDPDKFGWHADELLADWEALESLENLDVCGLMTIAPLGLDEAETRELFDRAYQFWQERHVAAKHWKLDELSMGMSGDYGAAIAAGATIVRVGRTIFGERS